MALEGIQAVQLSNTESMLGAFRDLADSVTLNPGDNKPRAFPSALAVTVKANTATLTQILAALAALGQQVHELRAVVDALRPAVVGDVAVSGTLHVGVPGA